MSIKANLNSIFLWLWYAIIKKWYSKTNGNHPSGTWGDAEQESGGVVRKKIDFYFFMNFLKYVYRAI